ncbi:MAG: DNA-methyltransferase [Clostridium chrysemydis]|uniref:DNA-methyltransferase n=1 Tax=Clostridium chrysemydis TaxID=2665504 RepID=UPI003F37F4B5
MHNIENIKNTILHGDVLEQLKLLPNESVDMCITSPPYWNLRDYGIKNQIGLENTCQEYIGKMLEIFNEVKRVLKNEGSFWLNIRDTYSKGIKKSGVKSKSLSMIPERIAIKMLDDGWILRNDIIWHKPNAMPDSCKNRFTVDYEHVYFFTKVEKDYYFETQYEGFKSNSKNTETKKKHRDKLKLTGKAKLQVETGMVRHGLSGSTLNDPTKWNREGRIKRTTWSINTKPFKGCHLAPYPEDLIETPIKAGCPKNGIVLDIFMGSGTTGMIAKRLERNYIGIELNEEYIKIANDRIKESLKTMTKETA